MKLNKLEADGTSIEVGTPVNWESKDFGMVGDVVAYIGRDDVGTITHLGMASWKKIFTSRMKFDIELSEGGYNQYSQPNVQVGHWYKMMIEEGLLAVAPTLNLR